MARSVIVLAQKHRRTDWIAKVRIEERATCSLCDGPIGAGEVAFARSEVPPDIEIDGDARLELAHPRGRCVVYRCRWGRHFHVGHPPAWIRAARGWSV